MMIDETLNSTKADTILAFYNLFCDDLKSEPCKSLKDTRQILYTIVKFIRSGNIQFCDGEKFGFRETVDFIRSFFRVDSTPPNESNNGESLTLDYRLEWKEAKQGNLLEIAKILLALIYALRIEHSASFTEYVMRLSKTHHNTMAYMIKHLDDVEVEESKNFDLLADLLTAPVPDFGTCTLATISSISNQNLVGGAIRPIGSRTSAFRISPEASSPTSMSPISRVIGSPRGKLVEELRRKKKRIFILENRVAELERESELLECKLKMKEQDFDRFRKKYAEYRNRARQAEELDADLQEARRMHEASVSCARQLERDLRTLTDERDALRADYARALEKLRDAERTARDADAQLQAACRELADERSIHQFTKSMLDNTLGRLHIIESKYEGLKELSSSRLNDMAGALNEMTLNEMFVSINMDSVDEVERARAGEDLEFARSDKSIQHSGKFPNQASKAADWHNALLMLARGGIAALVLLGATVALWAYAG